MKTLNRFRIRITALAVAGAIIPGLTGFSQTEKNEDQTLSPYFFVKSDNPTVDQLPLQSTSANVNIAGVIADVKVTQAYKNNGKNALEAIYIFPASTRAAVYGMKMTIGEREIIAIVQERQQARQSYEKALKDGKTASLLEQQRPNVFQMNVGNILPGDLIKVELSYTELLVPTDGIYQFVYPTVVGPRYSNKEEGDMPASEKWVANPYTHQGERPMYRFDININISAGMPIAEIKCPSHEVNIQYSGESTARIGLKNAQGSEGNKDFILDYKLSGNTVASGLLLYQGKDENFFLAMIQPPARVTTQVVPPRDYVFIMDVSGSMHGFPLEVSKTLLKDLISGLKPTDRFNVLLFSGSSSVMSEESVPVNPENVKEALRFIDEQQGGGGTELLPALQKALSIKGTENFARTFVIATDGYVSVEKEAFDLIRNNLNKASFFAFGIGSSVNRFIIEGMAHAGKGEPFIAVNEDEARKKASLFRKYIEYPVLVHITSEFKGFDAYDVEPSFVPDVFAERPVLLIGKWKGSPSGQIILRGTAADKTYLTELNVPQFKSDATNSALTYLWARERIRLLDDYQNLSSGEEGKKQVIQLGLRYNLLTNYTSFIAVDSEIRNKDGKVTTVSQPLPLPEGVSDYAVGYSVSAPSGSGMIRSAKSVAYEKKENVAYDASLGGSGEIENPKNEIFLTVEEMPQFPGDMEGLKDFIRKNIRYPETLKKSPVSGKVYLSFVIDKDGSVIDVKILRGLHALLDAEAERVIKLTSKMWKPGKQGGKPVKVQYTIPVDFKINEMKITQ